PAVEHKINFGCGQSSIELNPGSMTNCSRVSFCGCCDVFASVVDYFDWTFCLLSKEGGVRGNHRRVLFLAPESSAGSCLNDNCFFIAEIKQLLERFVNIVWALHRTHYGHLAVAGDRDHTLR